MAFSIDFSRSSSHSPRETRRGATLALPAVLWLGIFFILPLLLVLAYSLMSRGAGSTVELPLTLEHYERAFGNVYFPVVRDSIFIAFLTTVVCLVFGYPLAFFIGTRQKKWVQQVALFLVILPFWTNFLVRTYAWQIILGDEGTINTLLMSLGLIQEPLELLYTDFAVIVGLVYGYLPFMVLPIYTSVERFEFRLVEAAHDLGANDWKAFWRVVLPLTLPGVVAGCILVFIPTIGAFVTPALLGGTKGLMIGTLIERQFKGTSGNFPLGSAISAVMMGIVLLSLTLQSGGGGAARWNKIIGRFGLFLGITYMLTMDGWISLIVGVIGAALDFKALRARVTALLRPPAQAAATPLVTQGAARVLSKITSPRTITLNEGQIRRDLLVRRIGKIGLLFNPVFNYFFLWAPILLLVIFSFNDSRSVSVFQGFTTRWYQNIFSGAIGGDASFSTEQLLNALGNSLFIGITATIIATVLGTMVALSLVRGNYRGKGIIDSILYLPVVIPEITQAISLLTFFSLVFSFVNRMSGGAIQPNYGYLTIIIGHVVFNISYVTIVVRARLADMNPRLEEAARDLGANEWRTFWRITFPLILPGVISGALLAFTLSLDDFVVTFFVSGPGTTALPVYVYGLLRLTVTPEINAISTLMLVASTALISISMALQGRGARA